MSNLGFHIIYQQLNSRPDIACERLFLPDRKTLPEYVRTNTALMTIETQRPLYEFGLIGFAVTFEMDYFNIVTILNMGKVSPLAAERQETDPIVIIGGPCATFNPEPLAEIGDVFVIGEGEEVIHELMDTYFQCRADKATRRQILFNFAQIPGIYVPCFYHPSYGQDGLIVRMECETGVPERISRRWVRRLDDYPAHTVVVTDDTEFKDMFLVEVARGCGRHCRFCMAGYCYRSPRVRSLAELKKTIDKAKVCRNKVGLMGAAISDYPQIDELCDYILEQDMGMSVASLRADSLSGGLVRALAACRHKTITLAPEAASARMRSVINKTITDEHLFQSIDMAVRARIPNIRLYIMIGLPFERQDDIEAVVTLAAKVKEYMEALGNNGRLTLSINPFIPKPFTPFQWVPMARQDVVEERLKYIQNHLRRRKGIEVLVESTRETYIQGVLARGDRRIGNVLLEASAQGGAKAFFKALKQLHYSAEDALYRERAFEEILPWNHLDMGLKPFYLLDELKRAREEVYTAACTKGCTRCGICQYKDGGECGG
jgi:radical SAM family uncharacterized protein